MKISGPGIARAADAKPTGRSSKGGERFVLGRAPASGAVVASVGGQSLGGVDALLALQGVDDPVLARKRKIRRNNQLLDALDELKADLLGGRIGEGKLNRLMALAGQRGELVDPELDAIGDEINLRVRVELAKLGR